MLTVHVPKPEQPPPDQPPKLDPGDACAVSVTNVPWSNRAEQVLPQSIPDGELVTLPEPESDTVNWGRA
jgi:hypothetical protein